MKYYLEDVREVFKRTESSENGLTQSEAERRLEKYGKNKLLQVEYQPAKELRDSIGRYFHLYGYSCDEYGVPNWNTRIWSEYYVMEPDFLMSYIEKDYEADISARMQAGFRLLHRGSKCNKENGKVDTLK